MTRTLLAAASAVALMALGACGDGGAGSQTALDLLTERADVVAHLNTLADAPKPLPKP